MNSLEPCFGSFFLKVNFLFVVATSLYQSYSYDMYYIILLLSLQYSLKQRNYCKFLNLI